MAYTASFSVNVGDPTKASDVSTLAANDDYLKAAVDAIMNDAATPTAVLKSGVSATTQSAGNNTTLVATTAFVTTAVAASSTSPAGSNTQVQYNNSGSFGASANLTFASNVLGVSSIAVGGGFGSSGLTVATDGNVQTDGTLQCNSDFLVQQGTDTTTATDPIAYFERTGSSQTGIVVKSNSTDSLMLRGDSGGFGAVHSYEDLGFYVGTRVGSSWGTQALRIETSGNVGVNHNDGTSSHKLQVDGTAGLSTGTAWTNTSDARIKTDVATITGALAKIKQLRPVSYKYTAQYLDVHDEIDGSKTYNSFIADEYAAVFPDAVNDGGDLVKITNEETGDKEVLLEKLKQYTPTDLPMYLVAAVQELATRVEALES